MTAGLGTSPLAGEVPVGTGQLVAQYNDLEILVGARAGSSVTTVTQQAVEHAVHQAPGTGARE